MQNYKILIAGFGVVGQLEYEIIKKLNPEVYDKYKKLFISENGSITEAPYNAEELATKKKYDLAIIAVPTPLDTETGILDSTEVLNAINTINAEVYLVKSTVNIGDCDRFKELTGKRIVHSPEYSGATQHCTNFDYNYTILGGDLKDCQYIQQIYQEIFDARHIFDYFDCKTSEMIKLTENAWLASKVSFFTSIWEACNQYDISYENVRRGIVHDPRINPAHTFVYDKHPWWDSHCFNKDFPALMKQTNNDLLKAIYNYNNKMKEKYKNN